jgi:hypothetical protein
MPLSTTSQLPIFLLHSHFKTEIGSFSDHYDLLELRQEYQDLKDFQKLSIILLLHQYINKLLHLYKLVPKLHRNLLFTSPQAPIFGSGDHITCKVLTLAVLPAVTCPFGKETNDTVEYTTPKFAGFYNICVSLWKKNLTAGNTVNIPQFCTEVLGALHVQYHSETASSDWYSYAVDLCQKLFNDKNLSYGKGMYHIDKLDYCPKQNPNDLETTEDHCAKDLTEQRWPITRQYPQSNSTVAYFCLTYKRIFASN